MAIDKTTYVLGAGFSIEANAPSQEKLISKIFEIHEEDQEVFGEDKFNQFKNFLENTLYLDIAHKESIPLEDIFTPIDRCLIDNLSLRGLSRNELLVERNNIYFLIAKTLDHILQNSRPEYIREFAKFLILKARARANHHYRSIDPISVLSMNWDILLDNAIQEELDIIDLGDSINGVVDYCCYISSYQKENNLIKPGLEVLGAGGFNVKLLKLHGSLNWLACSQCQRLYVGFYQKIGLYQFYNQQKCRHCYKNHREQSSPSYLTSSLVMPTFLKNLSGTQLKLIWQNAGVELSESNRIVFIGYSLPQADYEIRQLLSRTVRKNATIEVVDYGKFGDLHIDELKKRYEVFFGKRKVDLHLKGAKSFIEEEIKKL